MRQKKDLLLAYKEFNGTQLEFCREQNLLKGTFSKWLAKSQKILVTPDERVNVKRSGIHDSAKELLTRWAQGQQRQGYQVDVMALVTYAKDTVPHIFEDANSYNSEYVLCRRLLLEMRSRLQQYDLEDVSSSLLALAITHGPAVNILDTHEHGDVHRYKSCTARTVAVRSGYGFCKCEGMYEQRSVLK